MIVAVQRIRDYLLSEQCQLPPKQRPQSIPTSEIKKRVTIMSKLNNMNSE